MIRDQLGMLADAQVLSYTGSSQQITQSDNWIDLGDFTDPAGITTHRDLGAGEPLYFQFRVTTTFGNVTDPAASVQMLLFVDNNDPPMSNSGNAVYIPVGPPVVNLLLAGFTFSLAAGNSFVLPLAAISTAIDPNATAISRSLGQRYLRAAFIITHQVASTTVGEIEVILTNQPSTQCAPQGPSNKIDGVYPASTHS